MIISKTELKSYLGITNNDDDSLLTILIDSANSFVANYINRNILADDYVEYKNGNAQRTFLLENYPVNSISSIEKNIGTKDVPDWCVVDSNTYSVDSKSGIVNLFFYQERGFNNYRINYNAGFTTVPGDLKLATMKIAGSYRNSSKSDGVSSETIDGDKISFIGGMSGDIENILDNYKSKYA